MKRGLVVGVIIVVLVILVGGFYLMNNLSSNSLALTPKLENNSQINQVEISNFAFNPATINIKVGETIVWTNKDSVPHTIISDSGNEILSETISNSGTYSHTFNIAGTYDYHCGIHTSMKGKVVVA